MTGDRGTRLAGGVLALTAIALAVAAAARPPLSLPVHGPLRGDGVLGVMQATWAVLVPLALVAAVALLAPGRRAAGLALGASSPILLVVLARLNGVDDAAALVPLYALTAAGVLLREAHPGAAAGLRLAAVVGVVPWGVVAFAQVDGLLNGAGPSPAVRVTTVLVLAAAVGEWLLAYRARTRGRPTAAALLAVAAPCVLAAAGVVLAVR